MCLIPEIPFDLDALIEHVKHIWEQNDCVVLCCAEGAGQDLLLGEAHATDASGNPILKDVGTFLRDTIKKRIPVGFRTYTAV